VIVNLLPSKVKLDSAFAELVVPLDVNILSETEFDIVVKPAP
jgi:hypothetical protein